jgi:hypothetical protein
MFFVRRHNKSVINTDFLTKCLFPVLLILWKDVGVNYRSKCYVTNWNTSLIGYLDNLTMSDLYYHLED